MSIIYRGFSTLVNKKSYSLTDYALAKQDLINYFNIRKGSKLMNPNFGTIIWDQLFEPLNDATQQTVSNDIQRIVSYDPRLRIGQIAVVQKDYGLMVQITLSYVPTNQTETLWLNFNKENSTLFVQDQLMLNNNKTIQTAQQYNSVYNTTKNTNNTSSIVAGQTALSSNTTYTSKT